MNDVTPPATPEARAALPPIATPPLEVPMAPMSPASAPTFGEYRLVQPLAANQDGELWLGQHVNTGAPHGLALLAKDALADPGAIWRMRQELGRHIREGSPSLLIINPPQPSDEATNLRQLRTVRAGTAVQPVRRTQTPEQRQKERKVLTIVGWIIGLGVLAIIVLYAVMIGVMVWPEIKKMQANTKMQKARSEARMLTAAVDQWAIENSIPEGTAYTWGQISDYAPPEMVGAAPATGPLDPLGNPYIFPPSGEDITVNPDTEKALEDISKSKSVFSP